MEVAIHCSKLEVDGLIARCRDLEVSQVCLALASVPGYLETGVPDRDLLDALIRRLAEAGLEVPVVMTWFGRDPALALHPADHRGEIDAKLRTLEVLGEVGIGTVLHYIDLAQPSSPADGQRCWDGLIAVFRELAVRAEAADVRLANHAIWRCLPDALREEAIRRGVRMADYRRYRASHWDGPYLLASHRDIIQLIEAVPSSHNGVCFCTGMHIMGGDVPSLVDTFKGKAFYAQMRDLRGRWPAAEEVVLGDGELDFAEILRLLDASGYAGLIGPEHLGKSHRPNEDLEAAAVGFLHRKLNELQAHQ